MSAIQPVPSPYVRRPAVAGRFYPADPAALAAEVASCLAPVDGAAVAAGPALAIVAPHAGYRYSGRIAGAVYSRTEVPARVVVLAPNHSGRGSPLALLARGVLRIPGADVPIDEPLAEALRHAHSAIEHDARAHELEHALEVQLPFLVARRRDVRVTPLLLGRLSLPACRELASALASAMAAAALGEPVLVVASSDMSHYLSAAEARRRDHIAIDRMLALDPAGLLAATRQHAISMCGVLPAVVALETARARGAARVEMIAYGTSGDVTGDEDAVVGYAALAAWPGPADSMGRSGPGTKAAAAAS